MSTCVDGLEGILIFLLHARQDLAVSGTRSMDMWAVVQQLELVLKVSTQVVWITTV